MSDISCVDDPTYKHLLGKDTLVPIDDTTREAPACVVHKTLCPCSEDCATGRPTAYGGLACRWTDLSRRRPEDVGGVEAMARPPWRIGWDVPQEVQIRGLAVSCVVLRERRDQTGWKGEGWDAATISGPLPEVRQTGGSGHLSCAHLLAAVVDPIIVVIVDSLDHDPRLYQPFVPW